MPKGLFTSAELTLAFDRVLVEHKKRQVFVTNAAELAAILECRPRWRDRLLDAIETDIYVPSPAIPCDVPKPNAAIRPGAILSFADQVVYTACVGKVAPSIVTALGWASPRRDFAYQIRDANAVDWLRLAYTCWKDFRTASIQNLDSGAMLLVSTDLTGFYEHISHELLMSDLRAIGAPTELTSLLLRCLNRWSIINGRGLPQSKVASHLLAKLYLNIVDRGLHDAGFRHIRYVDDMRLFCGDMVEAKRALLHLSTAVRRRGLSLQSAKTEILRAGEARDHVQGVVPTLTPLAQLYLKEIAEALGIDPKYLTVTEAEEALAEQGIDPPTALLQHAYRVHFMDSGGFEKTLFHYILSRLGKAKDPYASDHALSLLESHPDETEWILSYFGQVRPPSEAEPALLQYLTSQEAVYPYQHYTILRWRASFLETGTAEFLAYARRVFAAPQSPVYLRSAARLFLCHQGSDADLDDLAAAYATATDEGAKAECLEPIS